MTIQMVWQGFVMAWAILLPALASFGVGSTSALGNDGWEQFKKLWRVSVALGFVAAPAMLWALQSEFLGSWPLIACGSALISFVAHALGAKLANPAYQWDGENPLGLAIETLIIVGFSAVAGFVWSVLPNGGGSGWVFFVILAVSVGYIYFVYDDNPKGKVKEDIPLMMMSFVMEAALLGTVALFSWIILAVVSAFMILLRLSTIGTWVGQGGLFQIVLLIFWSLASLVIWWTTRGEEPYPTHVYD